MIKFPYMNMQQMNLDWIMDRVASSVITVEFPALSDDLMYTLQTAIDYNQKEIPVNFSMLIFGSAQDDLTKRAGVLCYKIDNDNMLISAMAFSNDYGPFGQSVKYEGVWSV